MLSKTKDLAGLRFGRWSVVHFAGYHRSGKRQKANAYWVCQCDCGKTRQVKSASLLSGESQSCGCLQREVACEEQYRHGQARTLLYRLWAQMIQRCHNPKNHAYKNYGGRGIHVCERWRRSFLAFREDMGEKPSPAHTLERLDNKLGYSRENCTWALRSHQLRNTRRNVMITLNGITQCLADWVSFSGRARNTIYYRLKRGWSVERALLTIPQVQ